ncbi:pyridoxal-phosphate dependent enzyme [Kribbella sp. NPDC050820]|uniref:pyridoxal-phosphate dependent enzyme n=1 Tax=Kribbella sp. NPDC050820 TaxID=3155408 RepID=UPI0033FAF1D6
MIGLDAIQDARNRIIDHILPTPLVPSPTLSDMCGVPVSLKLEHHQTTGSFKLRGATNAILKLAETERARGVVAVSTAPAASTSTTPQPGNHRRTNGRTH